MHGTLNPYPAYTPSSVPWLGDVPAHWEVRRLQHVTNMKVSNVDKHIKETELPVRLCNYVDVYKNDRITEGITFMPATATADEIEKFRLESGDVLITKDSETWNDIGVPALVEFSADDLIAGYHLALLRPLRGVLDGLYLFRTLQSATIAHQFHVSANGVTRYGLSQHGIKSALLPLPPLPEQTAIVRYLDHADRQMRRYIDGKETLIGLLEEQRQAVVQHAVTRGLDPDVRLKPSGIDWLGDVPAHWEVRRLKQVASLNPSKREVRASLLADTPVTFLPMEHVGTDGRIESGEMLPASDVWNGFTYFEREDVLVAKITPCFENGKGACLDSLPTKVGFGSTEFHVLRYGPSISPQFLYRLTTLEEFRRLGVNAMIGAAGQQRVPQAFVANYPIAIPPLPEQAAIVEHLDKATADIDTAIANTRREIDLLREYRTRLIADVVTGQVDVREAAVELGDIVGLTDEMNPSHSEETYPRPPAR